MVVEKCDDSKIIPCKRCKPEDAGCLTCGGYKIIITQVETADGVKYWTRDGVTTMYEGKRWHSFDGVALVFRDGKVWSDEDNG